MLPAWATVALSAITAVAAVAASLGGVWLQGRAQRGRDDRERRYAAAADMATGLHQASQRLHEALEIGAALLADWGALPGHLPERVASEVVEAHRAVGEARARLGRVLLLFGDGPVSASATRCVTALRAGVVALETADVATARERFDEALPHLWAFTMEARQHL